MSYKPKFTCERCKQNLIEPNERFCRACLKYLGEKYYEKEMEKTDSEEKFLRYEKLDVLYPVLIEELEELKEAIIKENFYEIYRECQDIAIVIVSIFNTVRLYKDGIINLKEAKEE